MTKYAGTYANALFDLACEEKLEDKVLDDITSFCKVLRENPDYYKLLLTPAVSKEEKKKLLFDAFGFNYHKYTMNFMYMLCDNSSFSEILGCEETYRSLYNKLKGVTEVKVITAVQLDEKQKNDLISVIEKKTGKKIILTEKIDSTLLGGIRLSFDGKEYDGSVAYHLGKLKNILSNN